MTPIWHDGPLAALAWDGESPVAWSVAGSRDDRPELARALLARLSGVSEVTLARSAAGAPVVVAPAGWSLGLSGRDGACLIGAARARVAVDREPLDDAPPLWDMLTPAETTALRRLPADRRPRAWLRRWTIKEAHAKLVGEPRRIAPEAIETVVDGATATASFEGRSRSWSRVAGGAIETVALWAA